MSELCTSTRPSAHITAGTTPFHATPSMIIDASTIGSDADCVAHLRRMCRHGRRIDVHHEQERDAHCVCDEHGLAVPLKPAPCSTQSRHRKYTKNFALSLLEKRNSFVGGLRYTFQWRLSTFSRKRMQRERQESRSQAVEAPARKRT